MSCCMSAQNKCFDSDLTMICCVHFDIFSFYYYLAVGRSKHGFRDIVFLPFPASFTPSFYEIVSGFVASHFTTCPKSGGSAYVRACCL